jgi:cyclopropane fatty-acyl-phospholipid synthase-like methyltransferase
MTPPDSFDPDAFKTAQRSDWQVAALGWRRWHDMLEAGGAIVSQTLVELANVRPGAMVLDIATGYGEPALTRPSPSDRPGEWWQPTSPPTC